MRHCENCPILEEMAVCPRHAQNHPPYCETVKPGAPYREGFRVELLRLAGLASPWSPEPACEALGAPPPPVDRVVIRAVVQGQTGYGVMTEAIVRGLEAQGVGVAIDPITLAADLPPSPCLSARLVAEPPREPWALQIAGPTAPIDRGRGTVAYTMWESSRLPRDAVRALNQCRLVIVPSAWNRDHFARSGVRRPIAVVPLGVDADRPRRVPRSEPGAPFRFGMAGRLAHGGVRKGLQEGLDAFVAAFPPDVAVELRVKVSAACVPLLRVPDDPRITLVPEPMTEAEMAAWYTGLDAFVSPSKGEGWGLHVLEAMVAAVPVVSTRYGGVAEYFDGACGWEVPFDEREVAPEVYANIGTWGVPRFDGLVDAMRAAAADPAEARRRGLSATARAREFSWDRTARELRAALIGAGMLVDPDAPPPPALAAAPSVEAILREPTRPLADTLELQARVRQCPERDTSVSCGCGMAVCGKKKGTGVDPSRVSLRECMACVQDALTATLPSQSS